MKGQIILTALVVILFVLIAGSITANFSFYKEYKEKIEYLEQQGQLNKGKFDDIEGKVDGFKTTVDEVNNQLKTYSESLKVIQNTVVLSEEERKDLLGKVENIKKDIQNWQKDYATSVIDLKSAMKSLKDNIDQIEKKEREIELGKITVKQSPERDTAAQQIEENDTKPAEEPAPAPKKAERSNTSRSGVRKISSFGGI